MQEWVSKNGFDDNKALLDYAYALSTHYGEAIGALSCQMYEATAAAQNVTVKTAEMAATPEYGEVAKAVNGARKQSEKQVAPTVGRLVKQVGADTTLKNAERDGAQFAWVPSGDTCAFCLTLASRGWQYMSKNALKNGHAEHIHANCDCEYAVRFDSSSTVEGYDPEKYLEMYNNAEGNTPQEKINSMRRTIAAKKKDKNSLQIPSVNGTIQLKTAKRSGLANRDVILSEEAEIYSEKLTETSDYLAGKAGEFKEDDVRLLSAKTGVEYAVLTMGDESVIIRGDSTSTKISEDFIAKLKESNGTFDYHTHPYDGDIRPSPEDMSFMGKLETETGQTTSKIISTDGLYSIYCKDGVVETGAVKREPGSDYEEFLNELFD